MDRSDRRRFRIGGLFASLALGLGAANAQVDVERARQNMEQAQRENSRAQEQAQREYWRAQEAARQAEVVRQQQADQQRRSQEQSDREKKSSGAATMGWGAGGGAPPAMSAAGSAQNAADMKALRTKLLGMPPLPDERNPLLGRWRVTSGAKSQRKDDMGLLMGMLANPGGAACQFTFGDGITEFKPKSWASIDGHGDDSLGAIAYRGDARRVWAIPAADAFAPLGFDVADRNRAVSVNLEGCTLVRVAAASATAAAPPPQSATATASRLAATPAAAAVVDGAAFRCTDGSLLHVSMCQGGTAQANCTLTELHRPGLQMGKPVPRADIAARVKACEAGGIRYGADDKPVFVR